MKFMILIAVLAAKNMFLLLKSLILEHILAKRVSCEIYTPYEGERGISTSRNGKLPSSFEYI